MNKPPLIRTSFTIAYDNCPYSAYLKYIVGIRQEVEAANMAFGTALHEAATGFINAHHLSTSYNIVEVFDEHWDKARSTKVLDYGAMWTPEDFTNTGRALVESFQDIWINSGYSPLIDSEGKPVIERRLRADFGSFILTGQPDVVAVNPQMQIVPTDIKTTATKYGDQFIIASEQLTDYQILVDSNSDALGLDDEFVEQVAFMEGLKRKVPKTNRGEGPVFLDPSTSPGRSTTQVEDRLTKIQWIVENMRQGRYPKTPRMAYNSPCLLCDYADYCLKGDDTGLVFPEEQQSQAVLALAS